MRRNPTTAISLGLCFILAQACASGPTMQAPDPAVTADAGSVLGLEAIDSYRRLTLRGMLWWQGFADRFATEHGIRLYRLKYRTTEPDGRLVPASALLVLPDSQPPYRGVVAWQHGTASLRSAAPSTPDVFNGLLPGVVFGGHGYVVVAPDYLGFGVSDEPHPYYHTPTAARVVVDALVAAHAVLQESHIDWPAPLFLAGFSQGGHTSLAAARVLESFSNADFHPDAVASVAGPIDLADIGFPESLAGRSRFASLYVAWVATTYARVYGEPVESVLMPPWHAVARELFDEKHDADTILARLPQQPRTLLAENLRSAFADGGSHWFVDRLRENGLQDWLPTLPVRLYFGTRDVDVPHADALAFAARAEANGAPVEAIDVGPVDHDTSILDAAPHIIAWFDQRSANGNGNRPNRFNRTGE